MWRDPREKRRGLGRGPGGDDKEGMEEGEAEVQGRQRLQAIGGKVLPRPPFLSRPREVSQECPPGRCGRLKAVQQLSPPLEVAK